MSGKKQIERVKTAGTSNIDLKTWMGLFIEPALIPLTGYVYIYFKAKNNKNKSAKENKESFT